MPKNFDLGRLLSYGSEGVVHVGRWNERTVAIKVLSNRHAIRAEAEAKLVMSCDQLNIIKYFALENENGKAYLAMEFINGGNLYDFIRGNFNSGTYWKHIDKILCDTARGMKYLHDQRIVQGDLKSHNVLLREKTCEAVICDFGISRYVDSDQSSTKRAQSAKGTIRWMAPEICTPPPELSSYFSDVWSYGCIILEVLSNREPWIDQYKEDIDLFCALQRRENATNFIRICNNYRGPDHLCKLLLKCCSWSKVDRPRFVEILSTFCVENDDCLQMKEDTHSPMNIDDDQNMDSDTVVENSRDIDVKYHQKQNPTSKSNIGRLTGEIYTSKGNASGRPIYEGPRGGRYYLSPSGSKVYLNK